jgi:ornithine carbamoyltransferase
VSDTIVASRWRHLLKDSDLSKAEVMDLLDLAGQLKIEKLTGNETPRLVDRNVALIFEKQSTRTRSAFEVAAHDQGAGSTFIDPSSSHMGSTESVEDTARVLGRMYDGIAFRGFHQSTVDELARCAGVPVWNALTDSWHPTQSLADLLTMREHSPKPLDEISVCFVGDGHNNVARSLMTMGAIAGVDVRIATPRELAPDAATVSAAERLAALSGGRVTVTDDVAAGTRGADYIYTDVWVSMGDPDTVWSERVALLRPYRVDSVLMASTGNPATQFLHCLPSIHDTTTTAGEQLSEKYGLDGVEVSDDVFRSAQSRVFDQAENRMHTIKALMVRSLCRDQLRPSEL